MGAEGWASAIFGGAAATLIAAALLAIFNPAVREKFWRPIGRALRWPFTLRLTTTRWRAVIDDQIDRLMWEVVETGRQGDRKAAEAELAGYKRGREEALAEIAAQRAAVLTQPVWRVVDVGDNGYMLNNTQSGVTIGSVSISAEPEVFEFIGDTQWPDLLEGARVFRGERKQRGRKFGVKFEVRWQDAHGDWQVGSAFLDRVSPRAVVF